ncbi:hypothetical protein [Demetria terragena]|uniref:hypothetical protein n=1 Tax=Demetria terragena TaxID=63959 RepID=UPI000363AA94|nr:hypothetical protein [Demetria terragena]
MTSTLTLAAIRFTDDIPAMRRFLETVGLTATTSWGDGMDVLRAGAGEVWLHSAATSDLGAPVGCTQLTGLTSDPDDLHRALGAAGFQPTIVDETYGRVVEVVDPLGDRLLFNGPGDGYGSSTQPGTPDHRIQVSLCRFTDPQGPYVAFAAALGLRPDGEPNEWYVPYSAGAGVLGLHHGDDSMAMPGRELGGSIALGLTTSGSLEELQRQLTDSGYAPGEIVMEDHDTRLETVDPDGQRLEIRSAPV